MEEINNQTIRLPKCWCCYGTGIATKVLSPYGQKPIIRREFTCKVCKGSGCGLENVSSTKFNLNREIEKYY